MVSLAPCKPRPIIEKLEVAIGKYKTIDSTKMHQTVKKLYSWHRVAERVEKVYFNIIEEPQLTMLSLIKNKMSQGPISGLLGLIAYFIQLILHFLLE